MFVRSTSEEVEVEVLRSLSFRRCLLLIPESLPIPVYHNIFNIPVVEQWTATSPTFTSKKSNCTMSDEAWAPEATVTGLFERALEGNKWASINSSTSGPRAEKAVPHGIADVQLYSLATPVSAKKICCLGSWILHLCLMPNCSYHRRMDRK